MGETTAIYVSLRLHVFMARPLTPVEAVRKNVISQVLLLQKQRAMAHSKAQTESNLLACTTNLEYLSLIYAPAVSWLKYQEIRQ